MNNYPNHEDYYNPTEKVTIKDILEEIKSIKRDLSSIKDSLKDNEEDMQRFRRGTRIF